MGTRTVLILTQRMDVTADLVVHELHRRRADYVRMDTGDFPLRMQLVAERVVRHTACLFQEHIPKRFELRLTIVGRTVYAAELHSQHAEATVDWRLGSEDASYKIHDLPDAVRRKCLLLAQRLGLKFAAIDMIVTPDGRYVFLGIQAFEQVPRHRFIDSFYDLSSQGSPRQVVVAHDPSRFQPEHLRLIYSDKALVTQLDEQGRPSSSASQPALVAEMLELLELAPGVSVLEIGAGTGYNAALMAAIVGPRGSVTTLDISETVAARARHAVARTGWQQVDVRVQDGFFGLPDHAPYDRIVATVGCPDLSPAWFDQLHPDGAMLIPLEHAGHHPLVRVWREQGRSRGAVRGWSGSCG